ncbi:DNA-3-methyladenine glycosylase family protein [Paraburkholderia dinghuensis]|uniref:DNA-3-methyladenine glycosylase II n=1 Tax=Paraburkholderia dinghuensis TaxID=2305225 RepID=A0A3N6PZD4_9BURK|nr:DNA-3-methyladenine glycosylase [Paraburkholderia dinghuensis]RQH07870.1 DNA-3-methyladenine glycosylase 2 family protein [Paraburkholderia dinghuensis]
MATATKAQARRSASMTSTAGEAGKRTVRGAAAAKTAKDVLDGKMASARKTVARNSKTALDGAAGTTGAAVKRSLKRSVKPGAKPVRSKVNGVPVTPDAQALHAVPAVQPDGAAAPDVAAENLSGAFGLDVQRPDYWDRACADLVKRDRILKKLIPKFGPVHLLSKDDPFVTLARSVVGQQISTAAAQALWQRVEDACPKLAPQQFLKLGHEKLAACGLSKRKAEYILDLAQHFVSGALHVGKWTSMDDEEVIAELTQIRGIGRWTAEMFLIFNLARPNVLPLDDLSLIRAISINYFSGEPVTRSEAREVAANWEPWRTVATWYMWRSLEPA